MSRRNGSYAHRGQDSRTSSNQPGVVTPAHPSPYQCPDRVPSTGPEHVFKPVRYIQWSEFWVLSVRSGRLRRSTGILCTVLHMDF